MTDPIIAPVSAIITPAIDAIVALRPESLGHFNSGGRWSDLPAMWRAQALLALTRVGDEARSARLRFAKGDALRSLCASEFDTVLPVEPQTAVGLVALSRPAPSIGTAPAGVVKKGTRFVKAADPNGIPVPIGAATYEASRSVYIAQGQLDGVDVPIVATSAGADANVPIFTNYAAPTSIQPAQPLFDPTLVVDECAAAGGSSGLTDPVLVAAARAYAIGQFGPTQGAMIAGMLRQRSVRHYAVFPAGVLQYAQYYPTDESWSSSVQFLNAVAQELATNWQGFGCRSRGGPVLNTHIATSATIVLKSADSLNDTDEIDDNVRAVAESYFNDRPDWYSFRLAALQSMIARADPRILHCSSVAVTDAVTGDTIPEPGTFGQTWKGGGIIHWYLTDRTVTTTYQPPS
jgi:hypothetical protein